MQEQFTHLPIDFDEAFPDGIYQDLARQIARSIDVVDGSDPTWRTSKALERPPRL